jgi:hypothetical protein
MVEAFATANQAPIRSWIGTSMISTGGNCNAS